MKSIILIATMLLTFGMVNAQIADVSKDGSYIKVYDDNNNKISSMYCSDCQIKGAAGSSFTIKEGNYIKVYDKNCSKKSSRYAG